MDKISFWLNTSSRDKIAVKVSQNKSCLCKILSYKNWRILQYSGKHAILQMKIFLSNPFLNKRNVVVKNSVYTKLTYLETKTLSGGIISGVLCPGNIILKSALSILWRQCLI